MKFKGTYFSLMVLITLVLAIFITKKCFKEKESLLFPNLEVAEISKITILTKEDKVILEKKANKWLVTTSLNYPANPQQVKDLIDKIKHLSSKNVVSINPKKKAFYGLDKDYLEVRVSKAKDKDISCFFIGQNALDFYSTYIQKKDSQEVILINEDLRGIFNKGNTYWRDRTILSFNPWEVDQLILNKEGKEIIISSKKEGKFKEGKFKDGKFEIIKPERIEAKEEVVKSILDELSKLKTDNFYLKDNLKVCGLDHPCSFIKVIFKNKLEKTLLVGNEDKNGQAYLKREGSPIIFLVSKYRLGDLFREIKDLRKNN
ncbi:DUF4340 domain-containing protein [bacterium]|nr:DUF4340 domain-containing protein [bacterium]MBU1154128.1 DUF4340 domain-containing protein [bacterium]